MPRFIIRHRKIEKILEPVCPCRFFIDLVYFINIARTVMKYELHRNTIQNSANGSSSSGCNHDFSNKRHGLSATKALGQFLDFGLHNTFDNAGQVGIQPFF